MGPMKMPRYSCASQDCCDIAQHGLESLDVDRSNPLDTPGRGEISQFLCDLSQSFTTPFRQLGWKTKFIHKSLNA